MIEKYCRELQRLSRLVDAITDEASQDMSINQDKREELRWELYRLKSTMADCLASIVAIDQEPGRP